jgi:hypothetical protein
MNWLANLSGKSNGFKEMDLLQEHQNFWVKVLPSRHYSSPSLTYFRLSTTPKAQIEHGHGSR